MGRPRADVHAVSTPERVLIAAEQAFAAQGFEARLGDIAAAAGIRRPSLLYHFESKEVLYAAVVTRVFANLGEALRSSRGLAGDFEQRLESMTRAFVRFVDEHPSVATLVVREMLADDGPGTAIVVGQVAPLLDEVVRWIETEADEKLRPGVAVRSAVMQVVSDVLLRSASGSVRFVLWEPADEDRSWRQARTLILSDLEEQ